MRSHFIGYSGVCAPSQILQGPLVCYISSQCVANIIPVNYVAFHLQVCYTHENKGMIHILHYVCVIFDENP
jgi:hypothetical protein